MDSNNKNSFIFAANHALQYKASLVVMFIVAICWALDHSIASYVMKIIIDHIANYKDQDLFSYIIFPLIIYLAIGYILNIIFRLYNYFVEIKMIPDMRQKIAEEVFSYSINHSYSYFQNNFAGNLASKLSDVVSTVPRLIEMVIDRFFSHSLALLIAVCFLWSVDLKFALTIFVWLTGFLLFTLYMSKRINIQAERWSDLSSQNTGKFVDAFSNISSTRFFARFDYEFGRIKEAMEATTEAERKLRWSYFWIWFTYALSYSATQTVNVYFLYQGWRSGEMTVGDFALVLGITAAIVEFFWHFAHDISQFFEQLGKLSQGLRILKSPHEIVDNREAIDLLVNKGEICFDKVQFHYKDNEDLFSNKSVTIEAGHKVGLVGFSGSGKTTFVNLILRLFDLKSGHILIDGQDISKVTQDSLRRAIAMIPQDPSLFHRTLQENIAYGAENASFEDIKLAAKQAHADEFIESLPEKYESLVGERGIKLSGGQRQRIAIARAFLKKAHILILDEATSQLDSVTENLIQDSLGHLMQNKTTIVIAHRLSTLLNMDRILVFDKGKIIEDGTHAELLAKNGHYKVLWEAQIGGFLPDKTNGV